MNDKLDFKGALEDFDSIVCDVTALTWFKKHANIIEEKENPIKTALRIADRVQSGEVSDGMIAKFIYTTGGAKGVYKAMTGQLIKEVCDE